MNLKKCAWKYGRVALCFASMAACGEMQSCKNDTPISGDEKANKESEKYVLVGRHVSGGRKEGYEKKMNESMESKSLVTRLRSVADDNSSALMLELTVINNTSEPIEFCKYHTPFEGRLTGRNVFEVLDSDGNQLPYIGKIIKRDPPSYQRGDFVLLKPGETMSSKINVASSYEFSSGVYKIKFNGPLISALPASNTIELELK